MTSPPAAEKTVAITGATGFIGAALLDLFLSRNFHVKALVRSPDKLAPWREQVTAVQGDLDNEGALAALDSDDELFATGPPPPAALLSQTR